eukprot:m.259525 g.259525  ORF g.259525 m.259525 type:complete len:418 (-) comp15554_c2_seq6:2505-3758(-)
MSGENAECDNVTSYKPTELVMRFHDAPHYDFSFTSISNTFNPDSASYQAALIQLAWPFSAAIILVLLILACKACCCNRAKRKPRSVSKHRYGFLVPSVIALGVLAACFFATSNVGQGVECLTSRLVNIEDLLNSTVMQTAAISNVSISNVMQAINDTQWPPNTQDVADSLRQELATSRQYMEDVEQIGLEFQPTQFNDQLLLYQHWQNQVTLGFSAFVAVLALVAVYAVLVANPTFISCNQYSLGISLLLCAVVGSVEFGLSVGIADFCADPTTFFLDQLGDSETAEYYMFCNGTSGNPYASPLNEAMTFINEANVTLTDIEQQTNQSFIEVKQGLEGLYNDVQQLSITLECTQANHVYNSALHDVCTTATTGLVGLMACHATAALLLLIALVLLQHIAVYVPLKFYADTTAMQPLI